MDMCIRRLGQHRGAPRLYLDTIALCRAGFEPGMTYRIDVHESEGRVAIHSCAAGGRRVSHKKRGVRRLPVIDLNNASDLAPVAGLESVRVIFAAGVIHVLALASHRKAALRLARLQTRVATGLPLQTAGIAFGAGVTSSALHAGLQQAGVPAQLVLANEISADMLEVALANNGDVRPRSLMINAPMQEAVNDDWLLSHLPEVDLLEVGIPCSGASRAGMAKRRLARMEDHPLVGHLVAAVIEWIAVLQPAILMAENVVTYAATASAAILRAWLKDAGYAVAEVVLDAQDFGSLESRVRWFLVAYPPELQLSLERLPPTTVDRPKLVDALDPVPEDDPAFRAVPYLVEKAVRDAERGANFKMQWLTPESTSVPTLRRGYHKGGSTDPRLVHPSDPTRSRLLTAAEHARIKGIDPALLAGLSSTESHEVCGQSVDVRVVEALGRRLGELVLQARAAKPVPAQHAVRPSASDAIAA